MSHKMAFVSMLALGAALVGGAVAQTTTPAMPSASADHHRGHRFDAMDANHDGALDKSEVSDRFARRFDEIDVNKDGKITKDEIKAGWKAHAGEKRGEWQAKRLAMLDTDHDGKVSWAESEVQAKARFARADANHDGYLDATELAAGHHGWGHKGERAKKEVQ